MQRTFAAGSDVYRGADRDGLRAADTHSLVVVELLRATLGNELEVSLQALDVAVALRTVFPGDETIARVSPRRFAALVERRRCDIVTVGLLGLVLERALGPSVHPRLWVEQLPGSADDVAGVLVALSE